MKTFKKNFVEYYALSKSKKEYGSDVDQIVDLIKNKKYKSILDIGCGVGTHAYLLSKKGYYVEGFDISKDIINHAKHTYPKMNFFVADASKFKLHKKFDVVMAKDSVLSFLTKKGQFEKSLKSIDKHINIKGVFIFDVAFTEELVGKDFYDQFNERRKTKNYSWLKQTEIKREGNFIIANIKVDGAFRDKKFQSQEKHIHRILKEKVIVNLLNSFLYL